MRKPCLEAPPENPGQYTQFPISPRIFFRRTPRPQAGNRELSILSRVFHLEFLSHAGDFLRRCDAPADLEPAVLAQVAHAVAASGGGELGGIFIAHDYAANILTQLHHLEDAEPAAKSGVEAVLASGAAPSGNGVAVGRDRG